MKDIKNSSAYSSPFVGYLQLMEEIVERREASLNRELDRVMDDVLNTQQLPRKCCT